MFNLNNKINQVRNLIQKLNSEIKSEIPENNVEQIVETHHKDDKNFEKISDSDIKLTKRSYALDQFIRKRDYIQKN